MARLFDSAPLCHRFKRPLSLPVWCPALKALHQPAFIIALQREKHTHTQRHALKYLKPLDEAKVLHEQHLFWGGGFDDKGPTSESPTDDAVPSHQKPTELIRAGSRPRHRRLGEGRLEVREADEKQGSGR